MKYILSLIHQEALFQIHLNYNNNFLISNVILDLEMTEQWAKYFMVI